MFADTFDARPAADLSTGVAVVAGQRCVACGHPVAGRWPRCPRCGGDLAPASFGPGGTVWSSTVIRMRVPGREPPYVLAYVDVDDGPRVLAHVRTTEAASSRCGDRVTIVGQNSTGDLEVER